MTKNKQWLPFPYFIEAINKKNYIFMVTDKKYMPMDSGTEKEYAEIIAHYKKFQHIKLYEYIEIHEKIRARKEVYFVLIVDGKEIMLSSSEISNPTKIATVFSRSFRATTTKRANLIAEYLESYDSTFKTNYIKGVNRTGWNGKSFFLPNRENKEIKLISNEEGLINRYVQKGDIDKSKKLIYEMSYKKSFIAFLAVLSAPLYGIINQMGAFNHATHINGASGRGKTLSINLALSLFGNPTEFKNNFSQTLTGAEMYLSENYDMPCFIDETESAKRIDDVIDTYYMFSNGSGKARGTMSGNEVIARDIANFRGHLLTSGEKDLESILNQSTSENTKSGVIRRVIDFEVGTDYLKSFNKKEEYNHLEVTELKSIAINNYGVFVDEWINIISRDVIKLNADFEGISKTINANLADKELIFYAFVLVLKLLFDNELIPKESYIYQYQELLKMIEDEKTKRLNVKHPYIKFIELFKEYLAMNKRLFGVGDFLNSPQIGEFGKNGDIYLAKKGMDKILKEFGLIGVKKDIIKSLLAEGIVRERSSKILGGRSSVKHWCFTINEKQKTIPVEFEDPNGQTTIKNHVINPIGKQEVI